MVKDALSENLVKYDEAIKTNKVEIEDLIDLESSSITKMRIDEILTQLMEEVQ